MTTRVQHRRSATAGNAPSAILPGEIQINQADGQLYFGDAAGAAVPALACRAFSAAASYTTGNLIAYDGGVYVAKTNVSPGAFTAADWTQITVPGGLPANAAGALINNGSGVLTYAVVLEAANNLSDLASVTAARTHLGLDDLSGFEVTPTGGGGLVDTLANLLGPVGFTKLLKLCAAGLPVTGDPAGSGLTVGQVYNNNGVLSVVQP